MHKSKHHLAEPAEENRDRYQTFRLTEREADELVGHARAGAISVSELVRRRVLGKPAPVSAAPELNRAAWTELSKTTSNLNQLCHHLNESKLSGPPDVLNLAQVKSLIQKLDFEVSALRADLLGASKK